MRSLCAGGLLRSSRLTSPIPSAPRVIQRRPKAPPLAPRVAPGFLSSLRLRWNSVRQLQLSLRMRSSPSLLARHAGLHSALALSVTLAGCNAGDALSSSPSASIADGKVSSPGDLRFVTLSLPADLTPDGSTALIQDGTSPVGAFYFLDT